MMWYERVSRWYENGWYEKTLVRKTLVLWSSHSCSRYRRLILIPVMIFFRVLLKEADLMLIFGRRYGLVGRNGIGKTTLIKMISR